MVKHRVRGKNKSILDYLSGRRLEENKEDFSSESGGVKTGVEPVSRETTDQVIDELLRMVHEKRKTLEKQEPSREEKVDSSIELAKPLIPSGEVLDEILYKGLGVDDVKCSHDGVCSDGHRIGEIFTDKYGFKRQRGFVNTTRLPVFLDWIVEEAVVQEILPGAYSVKTNRGSLALIPEDFLCELHTRYGVILKNYDKCRNYKPVIGAETSKPKRRRR